MDEGFCVVEVLFDQNNRPTDYRFVEINPAFEKQTGIANALGRTVREIVPQHEQHWYDIYGKVALTGEPLRFENRAQALNRWFDVFAYRVGAPEQRRVAVLFTDITKRKAADQALANAKVELEDYATNLEATVRERTAHLQQTITELEDFSFTVSHDLRSPLRSMQGFACALLNNYAGKLDAQGREYLQRISNSSVRLDRLILEVLDYSRAGRSQLAVVPVNLDKLLEEVMLTYPSIRTADAEIKIKHPLHPVSGSYASLTQCVANLLSNALKFIPAGSKAKIRIWTDKQDSRVRFFVKDNGIGISKEIQSKIFEPFQRGHPHAGYEGTGMGLAIVRKAIQRMHGSVGVESREGKGSTFWLELPAG
jgi:PAS domain S-box-containing protein